MAITDEQIRQWYATNAGATDADIAAAMDRNSVDTTQFATAMGYDPTTVQARYDAAKLGSLPQPTAPSGYAPVIPTVSDPNAADYVGTALKAYGDVGKVLGAADLFGAITAPATVAPIAAAPTVFGHAAGDVIGSTAANAGVAPASGFGGALGSLAQAAGPVYALYSLINMRRNKQEAERQRDILIREANKTEATAAGVPVEAWEYQPDTVGPEGEVIRAYGDPMRAADGSWIYQGAVYGKPTTSEAAQATSGTTDVSTYKDISTAAGTGTPSEFVEGVYTDDQGATWAYDIFGQKWRIEDPAATTETISNSSDTAAGGGGGGGDIGGDAAPAADTPVSEVPTIEAPKAGDYVAPNHAPLPTQIPDLYGDMVDTAAWTHTNPDGSVVAGDTVGQVWEVSPATTPAATSPVSMADITGWLIRFPDATYDDIVRVATANNVPLEDVAAAKQALENSYGTTDGAASVPDGGTLGDTGPGVDVVGTNTVGSGSDTGPGEGPGNGPGEGPGDGPGNGDGTGGSGELDQLLRWLNVQPGGVVTTKPGDLAEIGSPYDFSSIFASPEQEALYLRPYQGYDVNDIDALLAKLRGE